MPHPCAEGERQASQRHGFPLAWRGYKYYGTVLCRQFKRTGARRRARD